MIEKEKDRIQKKQLLREANYRLPKWIRILSLLIDIVSILLAATPFLYITIIYLGGSYLIDHKTTISIIVLVFIAVLITLRIYCVIKSDKTRKQCEYFYWSSEISKSLLTSLKRTHFSKTTAILQSTYGHMHEWRPTNICDNVLVYDIHEYLRSICIGLKEVIVNLAPEVFNDDMVTVDIAYEYPYDNTLIPNGSQICCPIEKQRKHLRDEQVKGILIENEKHSWKIITSGDHTSSHVFLHNYLSDYGSFYSFLAGQGYVFANDKATLEKENHYIWSSKDRENNRVGSIVGEVIELRNDDPEAAFIRAYLTISTYGRRFVEENDDLDLESFQQIFKETVINYYKTVFESEMAQMFVRHGIREGFIDRQTGKLHISDINPLPEEKDQCTLS